MGCPFETYGGAGGMWFFGIKLFLIVWIVAVPIIITSRLEKIIKLLEDIKFLEKFHPTTAVKLGAIAMGDALFGNKQNSTKQNFDEIKKTMLDSMGG